MAIQVNGTTVLDNSRNLTNITGADAATIAALNTAGVGGGVPEWQTVASSSLDTATRYEYTSPAIGVTMPNWEELQGIGVEFSFDAYRASPDGYGCYITLFLPQNGITPTDPYAFRYQFYNTFNSSQVDTWHNNQKVFLGWSLTSRYDLSTNSSGGSNVYFDYSSTPSRYVTRTSNTIFYGSGHNGYQAILSSDLNPGQSFNMYYQANDGYTNFRIRNAQIKFLAKYA